VHSPVVRVTGHSTGPDRQDEILPMEIDHRHFRSAMGELEHGDRRREQPCEYGSVKMHADQVDITVNTVAGLVSSQFPSWSGLPIRPVPSDGTVNALFRLGDEIVLRFPLQPSLDTEHRAALVREHENAGRIARHVTVEVPEPVAVGEPGAGYRGPWTAFRSTLDGAPASVDTIDDPDGFARDLASFVQALHTIDTEGRRWDGQGRGGPLVAHDGAVRRCLAESTGLTDTIRLEVAWTRCLAAGSADEGGDGTAGTWIHADLMPGNLLVRYGRLAAVIDLGSVCVGDPAVDLMPAWSIFSAGARSVYRDALHVDDATWERGRGWAIVQAIVALPYYIKTNPGMARTAQRTLEAVLE